MSATLSWYIARHFLIWLAIFFIGLSFIILVADLLELLRRAAVRPDVSLSNVVEMALLKLPHTAQELLPFALLFSAIMAFWRLTRTNELIVARAIGVSVWQFMLPAITAAVVVGAFKVLVFNSIAAATFAKFEVLEAKLLKGQQDLLTVSNSGIWLRQTASNGTAIIHAPHASLDLRTLDTVTVLLYKPDNSFSAQIDADRAILEEGYWQLENAFEAESGKPSEPKGTVKLPTDFTIAKIQESFARPETMSFWDLPAFIDLMQRAGFPSTKHRLYFQSQLAVPMLLSAMILIGATFSLRPTRRGGVGWMIAGGIAAGLILYSLSEVVYALGLSTRIPVMLAAWAPAVVSTLLGLAMLLHLEDG